MHNFTVAVALLLASFGSRAQADADIPSGLRSALPAGYRTLASATLRIDAAHIFQIVALGRANETRGRADDKRASARPLMIWQRSADARSYRLIGRSDHVVLRADAGGQCDPFTDGGKITAKGRFLTIENGVACGMGHWNDLITFRFDPKTNGFVFSSHRFESWSFNPDTAPDAESLIYDGVRVIDTERKPSVRFADWTPRR